jgi:hypothetical protein
LTLMHAFQFAIPQSTKAPKLRLWLESSLSITLRYLPFLPRRKTLSRNKNSY